MRVAPEITLTDDERTTLQRWSRGRRTPARLVRRAQIVLRAAEGKQNQTIAAELGVERTIVGRWRTRFAQQGLAGIEKDAPRGGRKPRARQQVARKIIEMTTQQRPAKRLRRGVFHNVKQLVDAITAFVDEHNQAPRSFTWTAKADDILAKVRRARAVLDKMRTG